MSKGCPVTVWDGPYSSRCGLGGSVGRCAYHGPFRTEPPEGWYQFGTHVDIHVPLEFSEELGEDGLPLWEKPDWSKTSFQDTTECAIHYALAEFFIEVKAREFNTDLSDLYIKHRRVIRTLATDQNAAIKFLREYE